MRRQRRVSSWRAAALVIVLALSGLGATAASAADKIRAGKTIGVLWVLTPVDIGVEEGIFARYGLDVEITTLPGDAKLMQGFVSGDFDVALGGSTGLIFALKGVPVRGVAALDGAPRDFSLIVGPDSPIASVTDLKGKRLGASTVASFPEWLANRVALAQGWPPGAIQSIVTGGFEATVASVRMHQLDGFIGATELGYQLEERQQGRIVVGMETFVPRFHTHVVSAREDFIHDHPDLVSRFLKGIFASIAFMKANRDETVAATSRIMNMSPAVIGKTYDYEIGMLSDDGAFDPASLKVLKDSYVEMGLLAAPPTDDQLLTTRFVPVKF